MIVRIYALIRFRSSIESVANTSVSALHKCFANSRVLKRNRLKRTSKVYQHLQCDLDSFLTN